MMPHLFRCTRGDASKYIMTQIIEQVVDMNEAEIDEAKHDNRRQMGFGKRLSASEMVHNIVFALFDQAELALFSDGRSESGSWLATKDGFLFSDVATAIGQICAGVVSNKDTEEFYAH